MINAMKPDDDFGTNMWLVDEMYQRYAEDPLSVSEVWRDFLDDYEPQAAAQGTNGAGRSPEPTGAQPPESLETSQRARAKPGLVFRLIHMYRVRGHLIADLDPLKAKPVRQITELDPFSQGLSIEDLERSFPTGGLAGTYELTLNEILGHLRRIYCRTIGVEFMHLEGPLEKQWIRERMELAPSASTDEDKRRILSKLGEAEAFETFLQKKYVGHKRFSLEGAESLIPILGSILDMSAESGVSEVVVGMAHRGRLNVRATIVGQSYSQLFREFEGDLDPNLAQGSGDVQYHVGATGTHTAPSGKQVTVTLATNPSHVESVDPVAEGMVRAKQDLLGPGGDALALLVHGDAAFAGQGVAAETLSLSQLGGYKTGGTVHIIVNNQLGFTTGSDYGRSSTYASDVAKMVQAPIFHVNGDDPEACVRVARLAFEFRQKFHKDAVVDMWCYRRWGHNETDEPAFTQPLMYAAIRKRRSVRKLYTEALIARGDLSLAAAEAALVQHRQHLDRAFDETKDGSPAPKIEWKRPARMDSEPKVATAVSQHALEAVLAAVTTIPEGFEVHPKLQKWLQDRAQAISQNSFDWALAEALAWGTLITEGISVRLSGQDSRRGTFSQRHSVLVNQATAAEYSPLSILANGDASFRAYDSLLSEFAVLGFEYGYSVANPDALVIWEAQFGDFANGAQVIIDNFIAAAEDKWGQTSKLMLLLPHGFDGQGPEHSTARLERFLQLCAEDNMHVVSPTTPAQYFHLLRFQARRSVAKPLVVMAPKWLLRLPEARSPVDGLTEGGFQEVLGDPNPPAAAQKVIACHGKVYYELAQRRLEEEVNDVALIRIEQLYPFPADSLGEQLKKYPDSKVFWVQEEPKNMGAWNYVQRQCSDTWGLNLVPITRGESASPATGSLRVHRLEQDALIQRALFEQ